MCAATASLLWPILQVLREDLLARTGQLSGIKGTGTHMTCKAFRAHSGKECSQRLLGALAHLRPRELTAIPKRQDNVCPWEAPLHTRRFLTRDLSLVSGNRLPVPTHSRRTDIPATQQQRCAACQSSCSLFQMSRWAVARAHSTAVAPWRWHPLVSANHSAWVGVRGRPKYLGPYHMLETRMKFPVSGF